MSDIRSVKVNPNMEVLHVIYQDYLVENYSTTCFLEYKNSHNQFRNQQEEKRKKVEAIGQFLRER